MSGAGSESLSKEADHRSLTSNDPPRSPSGFPNLPGKSLDPPNSPGTSPHSPLSHGRFPERSNTQPPVPLTPGDKFRSAIKKIIRLRRTSSMMAARGGAGAEPGVDPRRQSATLAYGHVRDNCVIEVCDFSSVRSSFGKMTNKGFIDLLSDPVASTKEPWVKVRWINIGGLSWDVISAVGLKYNLHPLALEDVLHSNSRNRSKCDYYTQHLFLRILCHSLGRQGEFIPMNASGLGSGTYTSIPRCASPASFDEKDTQAGEEIEVKEEGKRPTHWSSGSVLKKGLRRFFNDLEKGTPEPFHWPGLSTIQRAAVRDERVQEEIKIEEFKRGDRVQVKVEPICVFLTRDGTVVSIHPTNNLDFTSPITARLRQRDSVLRTSADPSLLVQSILDLVIDRILEVVDEYQGKILKLEHDVLLKPQMKTIRSLHILSGDLTLHKRTIEPVKSIIYGLRHYDVDRCAALVDQSKPDPKVKVEGFMTHKAQIYLADVFDHIEHALTSLDIFVGITQNLINYSFNTASHDMNEVMRRLTLATIIFLPLTLLTGYFGMNFPNMWSLHGQGGHSDVVFWIIALPIMAIILPIFLREDIIRMVHYVKKRTAAQLAVKTYKQA